MPFLAHGGNHEHQRRINCAALHQSAGQLRSTPHSGYHYDGRKGRFFEGWYFKVTLPGEGQSFALIYSIEDPAGNTAQSGVGAQVMGPDDSYLLQYGKDVRSFWADPHALALGACFRPRGAGRPAAPLGRMVPEAHFNAAVEEGYQASLTWHQGALVADEAGAAGNLPSTVLGARWAFSVRPVSGWGAAHERQRATAGWLAALPVFEPHWQIVMAQGRATGWIEWGGQRYDFEDAPSYAEKNWGGGFPSRWFWVQCEAFEGEPDAALTSVGARRGVLNLPGVEEDVGLIGIHWRGRFIELVPWNGSVSWEVAPWGSWRIFARSSAYEALVEATCERSGTPLRAPTATDGLAPFCRDSFNGQVRMRVWERDSSGERGAAPMIDTRSSSCAVEVGGGPWWDTWRTTAEMKEPLRSLVQLPVDAEGLASRLPKGLRPPGL
ncbi:hypothetical protein WJX81_007145 [Elliptochloris bilobata]|uniref:Tocopherol cyclase n=1 Tax=Elliptochloris bilobata TaxID=381761 RepID=A0AAW1RN42_9CHLO